MQSNIEMAEGKEYLSQLLGQFGPDTEHWNEAQNRFQFVDELLTRCLGWQKPQFEVEVSTVDGGRADYVLAHPAKAVLEAKRPALLWEDLPAAASNKTRHLRSLCEMSAEFKKAVLQVIPYCAMRGAQIGIVCNGPQLAIFQAITIGSEPLDGHCFLFNGFKSYEKLFPLLWKLLSPEAIAHNHASNELAKHRVLRLPPKASTTIAEPFKLRYRNPIQQELRTIGSALLEEVEDDPDLRQDFYRECYVPLEANNRHLNLSKQIIEKRYQRLAEDASNPTALKTTGSAAGLGDSLFVGAGSKPIVVIGDVGVGKTSFFENLTLSVDSADGGRAYVVPVDLGTNATLVHDLKDHVLESIPATLLKKYKIDILSADFVEAAYDSELKQFDKGIFGSLRKSDPTEYAKKRLLFLESRINNKASHVIKSLSHIAHGRKKRVVIIIDNCDQRDFDDQQSAFLIAQELAATRAMFVFVALRPSTFYLSKATGALSAYQNKILTISPPPADIVIEKRIGFALRVAEGKLPHGGLEGVRLNLQSIVSFLRATLRSVRSNHDIRAFLSNITGGNVRAVIELITTFCGSPNVDARKIVEIETDNGDYRIPFHEFTKHALLGEYQFFNPQSSLVACNVYDVAFADPREHFLKLLIVAYLSASDTTRDKDGFAKGEVIQNEMAKNGFTSEQSSNSFRVLAEKKLIETPYSHFRELDSEEDPSKFLYRATSVGIYHLRQWSYAFSFLDAVSTDTPIFNDVIRRTISDLASSLDIRSRAVKARAFRDYLLERWHAANFESNYLDFPNLLAAAQPQFDAVARATQKTGFQPVSR